jgi:hypothetical protein
MKADKYAQSIERVELAIKIRNNAFIKMKNEFVPNGNGVVSKATLEVFDAADDEFNAAKTEMDKLASEIRNSIII